MRLEALLLLLLVPIAAAQNTELLEGPEAVLIYIAAGIIIILVLAAIYVWLVGKKNTEKKHPFGIKP